MKALFCAFLLALAPAGPVAAAPMRVALLIDTSAATSGAIAQLREAMAAFLDALAPEHEVAVITTGRRTQVRMAPTLDRTKLKANAAALLSDGGGTSLIDALTEVDERFMRKAGDRWPVFVIVTGDGSENSKDVDEKAFNRWMGEIARRGAAVNAVVLKTGTGLPDQIAATLVRATLGHYTTIGTGGGWMQALTKLAGQLNEDAASRR